MRIFRRVIIKLHVGITSYENFREFRKATSLSRSAKRDNRKRHYSVEGKKKQGDYNSIMS